MPAQPAQWLNWVSRRSVSSIDPPSLRSAPGSQVIGCSATEKKLTVPISNEITEDEQAGWVQDAAGWRPIWWQTLSDEQLIGNLWPPCALW